MSFLCFSSLPTHMGNSVSFLVSPKVFICQRTEGQGQFPGGLSGYPPQASDLCSQVPFGPHWLWCIFHISGHAPCTQALLICCSNGVHPAQELDILIYSLVVGLFSHTVQPSIGAFVKFYWFSIALYILRILSLLSCILQIFILSLFPSHLVNGGGVVFLILNLFFSFT